MAKQKPNTRENETPFQRFERVARKLVAVPKREIDKEQRKWEKRKKASLE